MTDNNLHICCNIDDTYAQHCGVMLCSLFEHNGEEKFEVHILINELSQENKNKLRQLVESYLSRCHFHFVDSTILKGVRYRENRPLTEATYYRLLISSLVDESVSKILYLDTDMIVLDNITPLFFIDIEGYALAAAKDPIKITDEHRNQLSLPYGAPYFNAGLMMINLDYWRLNDVEKDLISFAKKERKVINHDQDALNSVFREKWFMLSPKWNRYFPFNLSDSFFENTSDRYFFEHNPTIIHFIGFFKPWNKIYWFGFKWNKYRHYYRKYLSLSPWKGSQSKKMKFELYQKFGLYRFLFMTAIVSFCQTVSIFLTIRVFNVFKKMVSLPFIVILKIYYNLRPKSSMKSKSV